MVYVVGFVLAVPAAKKDVYIEQARAAMPLFREFGVSRMVETWGDDVPDGKVTDFRRAVLAEPDEVILFSWFEYPSKEVADTAEERMMTDPRMQEMGENMPFDGQRMIYAGFTPIVDERTGEQTGYVDGSLVPVPNSKKDVYRELAMRQAAVLTQNGATRVVEAWGESVPEGKITDFKGAVKATSDEKVVYSWIEWPSKEVRDAAWQKVMTDPLMFPENPPYDNQRRVFGGFAPILDA